MNLHEPISSLLKTSVVTIKKLKKLDIHDFWDLINYITFRYEDYLTVRNINEIGKNKTVTIKGKIEDLKNIYTRRRYQIQKVEVSDKTGKIEITWFNQPYLIRLFKQYKFISISGDTEKLLNTYTLKPKEYEILESLNQKTIHTGRIIPIYSSIYGLSSRTIREKIFFLINNLENIKETLPEEIIKNNVLFSILKAYKEIHFPSALESVRKAKERLAFDELFTIQLTGQLTKIEWRKQKVRQKFNLNKINRNKINEFINNLPFKLTSSQKRCIKEIEKDLISESPMNRFLQGDVGSGKTIVATIASYIAVLNNKQTLIMAPTEILANQHYKTITNLFKNIPLKTALQTSSIKTIKQNNKEKQIINNKQYDIIIGTQALLNKKLSLNNVGLVIIDEQHRFGVHQRAILKEKALNPHLLTMTATPIPRTVSLTLYGELDMSIIDEIPKGRLSIKTYLVPQAKRENAYKWIAKLLKKEKVQVFIVCPLIEESEIETMKSVKAAKKEFDHLKNNVFNDFKVGLLHGKVKSKEKDKIMCDFKSKKYDILVTTPVVEVGIDIANACVMIIEAAERFGLAQLHQLRGRVGRGKKQSYCFLFTEKQEKSVISRLKMFTHTQNGIKLAEYDLKKRGPGEIFGIKQHGYKDLKVASFSDLKLIEKTKKAVYYFLKNNIDIKKYPELEKRVENFKVSKIARD